LVCYCSARCSTDWEATRIDVDHFRQAKRQRHNVVFEDASRRGLLEAAGLPRASAIAITFDGWQAVEPILHFARERNPDAPVIVSGAIGQSALLALALTMGLAPILIQQNGVLMVVAACVLVKALSQAPRTEFLRLRERAQ